MRSKMHTFAVIIAVLCLSGCASYQRAQSNRPAFPLPFCDEQTLAAANREQVNPKSDRSLSVDNEICTTEKVHQDVKKNQETIEAEFRYKIEEPFRRRIGFSDSPKLGIALSGGGTKSAAFSSGVLAGMYENKLIESTDYISSVSGGGYAAYHLYAQLLLPLVRNEDVDAQLWPTDLYRDCTLMIGENSKEDFQASDYLHRKLSKYGQCGHSSVVTASSEFNATIRHESFVRCMQDVLDPGTCEAKSTKGDLGFHGYSILGSIPLIPASWIFNTVWDSGLRLSATAKTYQDGIGISYGSVPDSSFIFPDGNSDFTKIQCKDKDKSGFVHYCKDNLFDPDAIDMTYDELRRGLLLASNKGMRLPLWIIDATSTKYRSGYGWFATNQPSLEDVFEMTPISHGSERYGFVSQSAELHNLTVLASVVTAAAFFDANEQTLPQPLRAIGGVIQHTFNLGWGIDILNYNVSDTRINYHRLAPMPLNWLDTWMTPSSYEEGMEDRRRSAFIRLVDGGSSENLALYSQLKRGVRNIVVADAAEDQDGKFDNLCKIRAALNPPQVTTDTPLPYKRKFLYVPGLKNFSEACDQGQGYPITDNWHLSYPVLLGCVRLNQQDDESKVCSDLEEGEARLFIIKPAIDNKHIENSYHEILDSITGKKKLQTKDDCWIPTDSVEIALSGDRIPVSCDVMTYYVNNLGTKSKFPQHSTVSDTADSSYTIYAAYRELGRQYTYLAAALIKKILQDDTEGGRRFEKLLETQAGQMKPIQ